MNGTTRKPSATIAERNAMLAMLAARSLFDRERFVDLGRGLEYERSYGVAAGQRSTWEHSHHITVQSAVVGRLEERGWASCYYVFDRSLGYNRPRWWLTAKGKAAAKAM